MTEPYTPDPADVELVARALATHRGDNDIFDKFSGSHWDTQRDLYREDARVALSALAGRLIPADAETRTEWTVKVNGNAMEAYAGITTEANCRAIAADPPFEGHEVVVVSRFAARGPWLPAPTDPPCTDPDCARLSPDQSCDACGRYVRLPAPTTKES